jgi:hypothetical protein
MSSVSQVNELESSMASELSDLLADTTLRMKRQRWDEVGTRWDEDARQVGDEMGDEMEL